MAMRRKLSNGTSANIFIKTAMKTNSKNIQLTTTRGGTRL